jgi:hypothetical protein
MVDSYTPKARDLLVNRVAGLHESGVARLAGGSSPVRLRTSAMSGTGGSGSVAALQTNRPGEGRRMGMYIRRGVELAALVLGGALLGGCTTPGIVRLSEDTYRVSRADPGHVFADEAAMKAAAVADADAFARSRGLIAQPISFQTDTLAVGHLTTLDYEFRLVPVTSPSTPVAVAAPPSPSSPAPAAAPMALPRAAAPPVATVAPPRAPAPTASRDYVDELIRLDDLRKRGILTEDEFQTLKAKIISER